MTDGHIAIEATDLLLRPSASLPASRVSDWLTTRDRDVLSIVWEAVSKVHDRLDGGVTAAVYFDLVKTLFGVLLEKEGTSDYALGRYDAGRIFAAFLTQCARGTAADPEQGRLLRAGAEYLADTYKAGDASQRRCIVDGIVEHVFHDDTVRSAFSNWEEGPLLKTAYEEAADWSRG